MANRTAKKTSTPEEVRDAVLRGDLKIWKNGARVLVTQADRNYFLERFRHESGTCREAEADNPARILGSRT